MSVVTTRWLEPLGASCKIEGEWEDEGVLKKLVEAMESDEGQGVLVVEDLDLTPKELEKFLSQFGEEWGVELLKYDRWPGQSPGVGPHLALLGNYVARKDGDLGVLNCKKGDRIAEFKPATMKMSEWHTDGSFLSKPKKGIALYAPLNLPDALPAEGGETRFASCVRGLQNLDSQIKNQCYEAKSVHSWETFMRFLEARDPKRPKVTEEQISKKPDQVWPFVRKCHLQNGSSVDCLYLNPKNTKKVIQGGDSLLTTAAEAVVESGVYSHFWKPGQLVIFDNRRLLHAASPFDHLKYQRLLFRAEFAGEVVIPSIQKHLKATPETVAWGWLGPAESKLRIDSGEIVTVDTVSGSEDKLPVGNWRVPEELRRIHSLVKDRQGPHILTGPIAVRGAMPGAYLKIDILDIKLLQDWAWTFCPATSQGALGLMGSSTTSFDHKPRHTRLIDEPGHGWALPSWGGKLPLAPFFGVLGVAPTTRVNSIPPSEVYGGNLDLNLLTKNSTLYLPIQVPEALLFVGDGHARQGDGECCGTALETALRGTFKLTVTTDLPSRSFIDDPAPRAETPLHLIAIAVDSVSFENAAARALTRMLDWLASLRPKLDRTDAYCLLSVAADLKVTQLVNAPARFGVHLVLPKAHLPPP